MINASVSAYWLFTGFNTRSSGTASLKLFKHASKATSAQGKQNRADIEKGKAPDSPHAAEFTEAAGKEQTAMKVEGADTVAMVMTGMFSWQQLTIIS
ncbi:hypothetical protein BDW22DRAFT_1358572 [Trametopsis cervina]|nr:hypothetical protein BDW22DRAFT_1358572 [Trametopsis cervina]